MMECVELMCCVCSKTYNYKNPPRNVKCGHSVCTQCIDLLIPFGKSCPECRSPFTENVASDMPINYSLLYLSQTFRMKETEPKNEPVLKLSLSYPAAKALPDAGLCPNHGVRMFFMCLPCDKWICSRCVDETHKDPPFGRCFILSSEDAIKRIKKSHLDILSNYNQLANTYKERIAEERSLQGRLLECATQNLINEMDFKHFVKVLDELKERCNSLDSILNTCDKILKSLNEVNRKMEDLKDCNKICPLTKESTSFQSVFEKFLIENKEREAPDIKQIMLDALKKDITEIISQGRSVHVRHDVLEGDLHFPKWAPLVLRERDRLHIYSLRSGVPATDGVSLPFEMMRLLVPSDSPLIFMDVGWGGEVKGNVYVRMFGCTARSLQTVFLCSGEKGPSYRSTCFYQSSVEDGNCTIISGGDFENNNGTGGRAIVEGITSGGEYAHAVKAGLFVSWPYNENWRLGSFEIYLDDSPNMVDYSAHGLVEEGLDILKEISKISPISKTSVMECGLIILM